MTISTLGNGPRNFAIDPSGNFLLVANQYTNEVVIFKIDKPTGMLTDTGKKITLCSPVCLVFGK
jgi:6-phosphogluconolactonase